MIIYTLLVEAAEQVRGARVPFPAGRVPDAQWHLQNRVVSNEHRQPLPPTGMHLQAVHQLAFCELSAMRRFAASELALEWLAQLRTQGYAVLPLLALANEVLHRPARGEADGMLKRMGILRRDSRHSPEAFRQWWLDVHGPVAAGLPGLRGYVQNLAIDALGTAPAGSNGEAMGCDGFTELWFDDAAAMERAFPARVGTSVTQHANRYIEAISTLIVREELAP